MFYENFLLQAALKNYEGKEKLKKKNQQKELRQFVWSFVYWFWVLKLCLFWCEKVRIFF